MKCQGSCKQEVEEVCHDGYCRACHKTISWDSCLDGTWNNDVRVKNGFPAIATNLQEPIREQKP